MRSSSVSFVFIVLKGSNVTVGVLTVNVSTPTVTLTMKDAARKNAGSKSLISQARTCSFNLPQFLRKGVGAGKRHKFWELLTLLRIS